MSYKFTRTPYEGKLSGGDGKTVTFELDQDSDLDEMIQAYEEFLRASGFSIKGKLEIVEETEVPVVIVDTETSCMGDYDSLRNRASIYEEEE